MRTEQQTLVERNVRANRKSQRLAVDGCVPGDVKLPEFLRRIAAQSAVRVDRGSLFPNVSSNIILDSEHSDKCTVFISVFSLVIIFLDSRMHLMVTNDTSYYLFYYVIISYYFHYQTDSEV